jgi:transcriptional regulator of arginine metabolism
MANKSERQAAILELIGTRRIASQRELQKLLLQRGWDVTQATLSRDLHELRVARVPTPEGVHYQAPVGGDGSRAVLDALLPQLFLKIDGVAESIVLRTLPGGAQAIAEALDVEEWAEVVGTIAGDNTILILCRSSQARERVTRRLKSLAGVG